MLEYLIAVIYVFIYWSSYPAVLIYITGPYYSSENDLVFG